MWVTNPIYFITTNTKRRRPLLANAEAAAILVEEWKSAKEKHDWHVGQYVVMPDHVHFFCANGVNAKSLSDFMKFWKEWTSKRIKKECRVEGILWQAEFFDHVIRNERSYAQKKEYVFNNPVKAGLVKDPTEWPWHGEIEIL